MREKKRTPGSEIKLLRINTLTGKNKRIDSYDACFEIGLANIHILLDYGMESFDDFLRFFKEDKDKEIRVNEFIYKRIK